MLDWFLLPLLLIIHVSRTTPVKASLVDDDGNQILAFPLAKRQVFELENASFPVLIARGSQTGRDKRLPARSDLIDAAARLGSSLRATREGNQQPQAPLPKSPPQGSLSPKSPPKPPQRQNNHGKAISGSEPGRSHSPSLSLGSLDDVEYEMLKAMAASRSPSPSPSLQQQPGRLESPVRGQSPVNMVNTRTSTLFGLTLASQLTRAGTNHASGYSNPADIQIHSPTWQRTNLRPSLPSRSPSLPLISPHNSAGSSPISLMALSSPPDSPRAQDHNKENQSPKRSPDTNLFANQHIFSYTGLLNAPLSPPPDSVSGRLNSSPQPSNRNQIQNQQSTPALHAQYAQQNQHPQLALQNAQALLAQQTPFQTQQALNTHLPPAHFSQAHPPQEPTHVLPLAQVALAPPPQRPDLPMTASEFDTYRQMAQWRWRRDYEQSQHAQETAERMGQISRRPLRRWQTASGGVSASGPGTVSGDGSGDASASASPSGARRGGRKRKAVGDPE